MGGSSVRPHCPPSGNRGQSAPSGSAAARRTDRPLRASVDVIHCDRRRRGVKSLRSHCPTPISPSAPGRCGRGRAPPLPHRAGNGDRGRPRGHNSGRSASAAGSARRRDPRRTPSHRPHQRRRGCSSTTTSANCCASAPTAHDEQTLRLKAPARGPPPRPGPNRSPSSAASRTA